MYSPADVVAEIGCEQTGGNRMFGVGNNRKRDGGEYGLDFCISSSKEARATRGRPFRCPSPAQHKHPFQNRPTPSWGHLGWIGPCHRSSLEARENAFQCLHRFSFIQFLKVNKYSQPVLLFLNRPTLCDEVADGRDDRAIADWFGNSLGVNRVFSSARTQSFTSE